MNEFFEELVERAQYYERFDFVHKDEKIQTVFRKHREARMGETIIEC
jgi:hypothetical protein